ncbi:MAG: hypothetical protein ACTSPA_00950 [Promethearchaeota archaeon]
MSRKLDDTKESNTTSKKNTSGKRYSKEEKEEIMKYRQTHTYRETAEKYSVSQMSLARWNRKHKTESVGEFRYTGDPDYRTFLQTIKYLEGVRAVALFSVGSSVASIIDNSISEETLYLAMIKFLSEKTMEEIDLGSFDMLLTKTSYGFLFLRGVAPNLLLIMIYGGKTDIQKIINQDFPFIERVRQDIRKQFEKLE